MKKKANKKQKKKEDSDNSETKEYGVVLTKEKKYRHRIYPQKGIVPEEGDFYRIV